ncbi:MAG: hypothetical protein ISN28_10305 [Ectothiorhodospiraceae bacterium AqS1]|nr:hypothetical protein [Ectothiorhodospiraceae bacterium AqS1]
MSASSSDFPRLRPLDERGLSTATVYVKGFGTDDGDFEPWLGQHRKLESSLGWRSDVFGYEWPSGNGKKNGFWTALGGGFEFFSHFNPKLRALNLVRRGGAAAAATLIWLWSYKTAEKNAVKFAQNLADDIKGLNFEYERVQVVGHSLGCRLVIEAAARLSSLACLVACSGL